MTLSLFWSVSVFIIIGPPKMVGVLLVSLHATPKKNSSQKDGAAEIEGLHGASGCPVDCQGSGYDPQANSLQTPSQEWSWPFSGPARIGENGPPTGNPTILGLPPPPPPNFWGQTHPGERPNGTEMGMPGSRSGVN